MSLKYRGINYETAPSSVSVSEEVIGRYRGAVVTRRVADGSVSGSTLKGMKYRGATIR